MTGGAYQQALYMAARSGVACYVNVHKDRDCEVLLAQTYKNRSCCAIAHPDGLLEYGVQGYCHAVAMTQPRTEFQPEGMRALTP